MSKKIIKIDERDNYRIVAISDIHAHLSIFNELLLKVDLKDEDYLVIVGDFVNKGSDSYNCLKYIMKLEERPRTIILKGNHESLMHSYMKNLDESTQLQDFLKKDLYETLIHDFAKESGVDLYKSDYKYFYEKITKTFKREFEYLTNLPIMLEFDDILFVHGGFDDSFDISKEEHKFLKYDNYNHVGKKNKGKVIVGHWPAALLRDNLFTNLPFINNEKNIISIDGGIGVKNTGELNALIIEKKNSKVAYECVQANDYEKTKIVKCNQFQKEESVLISYPYYDIDLIEAGDKISICRHHKSGKRLSVINSFLVEKDNQFTLKGDYINNFLNLDVGTDVLYIATEDEFAFVKYGDEFGWVLKNQLQVL